MLFVVCSPKVSNRRNIGKFGLMDHISYIVCTYVYGISSHEISKSQL